MKITAEESLFRDLKIKLKENNIEVEDLENKIDFTLTLEENFNFIHKPKLKNLEN